MIRWLALSLAFAAATPCAAEEMLILNPPFIPQNTTVAGLPTCNAANTGVVYRVTDSLLPVLGIAVAGTGAVAVIVRCNGTAFLVGQ